MIDRFATICRELKVRIVERMNYKEGDHCARKVKGHTATVGQLDQ